MLYMNRLAHYNTHAHSYMHARSFTAMKANTHAGWIDRVDRSFPQDCSNVGEMIALYVAVRAMDDQDDTLGGNRAFLALPAAAADHARVPSYLDMFLRGETRNLR